MIYVDYNDAVFACQPLKWPIVYDSQHFVSDLYTPNRKSVMNTGRR